MLNAEVGEPDPEQLDKLNRYEKRPEADPRIFLFESQCC
jgi:hypothetical protein